jgi:hypothetical protein
MKREANSINYFKQEEKAMKSMTKAFLITMGVSLGLSAMTCFSYAAPVKKPISSGVKVPSTSGMSLRKTPDLIPGGQQPAPYTFCAIDSQGKLVILVKNQGGADAPASSTTVGFAGSTSVVLPTPPIPQNTTVPLQPITIPKACYAPYKNYDCDFNITVDSSNQIAELNENNNIGIGKCAPPCRLEVKLSAGTKPGEFNSSGSIGISVKCPTKVYFTGRINVSSMKVYPLTIKYQFVRSDGAVGPVQSMVFTALGTKEVGDSWAIIKSTDIGGAWEQLKILEPLNFESNKAAFRVTCTGQ